MNRLYFLFISGAILFSCANPVSPTGGAKDEVPPALIQTEPSQLAKNTKPKKITFTFNENIQLKNAEENITISPKYSGKPKISHTNKTISIELDPAKLAANTTYTITLNQTVSDLNEGNLGNYPTLHFSTGNEVDTFFTKGSTTFIKDVKTKKLKVIALPKENQLTRFNASLNNDHYTINGLKNEEYYILAWNDLNGNDSADTYEEKGLSLRFIGDSSLIYIYDYTRPKLNIRKNNLGEYYLSGLLPYHKQASLNTITNVHEYRDTLIIDSTQLIRILDNIRTANYIIPEKYENTAFKPRYFMHQPNYNRDSSLSICINANYNLKSEPVLIKHISDTTYTLAQIIRQTERQREIHVPKPGKYQVISASTKPEKSDTTQISIASYQKLTIENTDTVSLRIQINDNNNGNYVLPLLPAQKQTIYVRPATYSITAWEDNNNDYNITGPDYNILRQGEPVIKLKSFQVTEKFELIVPVSIHNKGVKLNKTQE